MFKRILSKYLLFWLTLSCLIGALWPTLFGEDFYDPFLVSPKFMAGLISVTMLAVGSLLPYEQVKQVARSWPKTLGGTAIQYLSMPTLAFCMAKLFDIEGGYFIGIMLAGCVPGAMASNVLTLTARGNVSYSVGLTTSATLLSPLVVPATLWLFLNHAQIKIDTAAIMLNLLETVVAPVAIGFTLARVWSLWRRLAEASAEIIANLAIIWIISSVVAKNFSQLSSLTLGIGSALALLNIGGYLAGFFGGKALGLDSGMRRALAIEVGMQNAGLGTSLAMNYFQDTPEAALVCATYTFGCMSTGIILAQAFRFSTDVQEKRAAAQADANRTEEASA